MKVNLDHLPIQHPVLLDDPEGVLLLQRVYALEKDGENHEAAALFNTLTPEHASALRKDGLRLLSEGNFAAAFGSFLKLEEFGGPASMDATFLVAIARSLDGYAHYADHHVQGSVWMARFLTPPQMIMHQLALVRWDLDGEMTEWALDRLQRIAPSVVSLLYMAEAHFLESRHDEAVRLLDLPIKWGSLYQLRRRMSKLVEEESPLVGLIRNARKQCELPEWPLEYPLWLHPQAQPAA
jgi:hypothetical protein